jgi:hypothetical protein
METRVVPANLQRPILAAAVGRCCTSLDILSMLTVVEVWQVVK